jgi:putative flippase GtrA
MLPQTQVAASGTYRVPRPSSGRPHGRRVQYSRKDPRRTGYTLVHQAVCHSVGWGALYEEHQMVRRIPERASRAQSFCGPPMRQVLVGLYRAHKQKILFLLVGGWNTAFQYGVFALCWYLLGSHLHSVLVLLISYLIASVNGFLGFRYVVFGPARHPLIEYLRFQLIYIPLLALNMVALPLLLEHTAINAYVAQASLIVVVVIGSYVGNKYFTFRKRKGRDRRHSMSATTRTSQTETQEYADGLLKGSDVWWKRLLDVQRPYRRNLQSLALGKTLDVGCGIGRNLSALDEGSLGVDHNEHSVAIAVARGHRAMTVEQFKGTVGKGAHEDFDSMLVSHVLEHMSVDSCKSLLRDYLPYVKQKVVVICPQRKGFRRDDTHVTFLQSKEIGELLEGSGLRILRSYSFPFPAALGKVFTYNETVVVATKPR